MEKKPDIHLFLDEMDAKLFGFAGEIIAIPKDYYTILPRVGDYIEIDELIDFKKCKKGINKPYALKEEMVIAAINENWDHGPPSGINYTICFWRRVKSIIISTNLIRIFLECDELNMEHYEDL